MGGGILDDGWAGEHTGVGYDRSGGVGAAQGPADRAVQHGAVPVGALLFEQAGRRAGGVDGVGCIVAAPHDDGGVVAEEVDHLAGLTHGLAADRAVVPAPHRQVLPDEHSSLVGRIVEGRVRDVGAEAQQVDAGVTGEGHVGSGRFRGDAGKVSA